MLSPADLPSPASSPRLLVALLLTVLAALPEVPTVVDDLYISYAYALSLLERGSLSWGGLKVEGYSNLSWVFGLLLARAGGLPVTWAAKGASLLCALALVVGVHRRAPPGAHGTALLLAVAGWSGLTTWAGRGMETPLFALLLWVGWGGVAAGRWTVACWALTAAAMTRPEGALYLVGALVAARGRLPSGAWAALAAAAMYHLLRVAWFGELVPLTILAKSGGSPDPFDGPRQMFFEWIGAAPVALLALGTWRADRRITLLALAPLALHAAMLLKMGGDWMGGTRIQMPGMIASFAALAIGSLRTLSWRWSWLALPVLLWAPSRTDGLAFRVPPLLATLRHGGVSLDTPLIDDVRFIVHTLPEGARFETGDIGIPSLIPGVRLVDTYGLVDPLRARIGAGLAEKSRLDGQYEGTDGIRCVRRLDTDPEAKNALFKKRIRLLTEVSHIELRGHRHTWWCAPDLVAPDPVTIRNRWLTLVDRLPELPAIRWHAARFLSDHGELERGEALYAVQPWLDPDPDVGLLLVDAPLPDTPDGRGFRLGPNGSIRTRNVQVKIDTVLALDGAGIAVDLSWENLDGQIVHAWSVTTPTRVAVEPPEGGGRLLLKRGAGRGFLWVRAEGHQPAHR